jgi:hypothetical protein
MSTVTEEGLAFADLSDEAKARAIERWQEQAWQDETPGLSDLLESDLSDHYGVTNCKLYYGLNYCQGDGVAFQGNPDLEEWGNHDEAIRLALTQITIWCVAYGHDPPGFSVAIKQHGHYCHSNSMYVTLEEEWDWSVECPKEGSFVYTLINHLQDHLDEAVKDISRKLEKTGYAEIEYHQSEEMAKEMLEDGGYRFDEDGDIL